MIKLILNDEEYTLPTSFAEINIDLYQQITKIVEGKDDKVEKMISLISVISGISKEDIKRIDMQQINIINHTLEFMFKKIDYPLQETFTMDGIEYGLNKDLGKISFGEFIDLESFSNGKKGLLDTHILMALLYRPIVGYDRHKFFNWLFKGIKHRNTDYKIQEYIDDTVLERATLFKEKLTMDIVFGSMFFFIILSTVYTLHLKGYSEQEMMDQVMILMNLKN